MACRFVRKKQSRIESHAGRSTAPKSENFLSSKKAALFRPVLLSSPTSYRSQVLHVTSAILYVAKQTRVNLFCFVADSLTFRCGLCHQHVVFAQAEKQKTKQTRTFLLPRKRQSKKSTQRQGLGPAYFVLAKKFSFLCMFSKHFGLVSSLTLHRFESCFAAMSKNHCSKFYNTQEFPHIQSIL